MEDKSASPYDAALIPAVGQVERVEELRRIWEGHAVAVRGLLARLVGPGVDVDDLRQEVFLIAWRKQELFEGKLPVRPWLFGVALRVAGAARRRARIRRCLGLKEEALSKPDEATPATHLEREETRRAFYEVLDQLSERKRTVFVLFELQGLTGQQISILLGCPHQTVRTRLLHARRDFAALMAKRRAQEQAEGS